ncbi:MULTISPECIES: hypothetical protein [Escherichia]|uniref:hypothetical protein n=1 Tax=Escherichia TaxID=561 RepID=UPI001CD5BF9E|nr:MULTISPECIES: hypothetical protein [Escherichia]MCO4916685.1 hypothetical protein [Escherichia coli]MCY6462477.1 hypothetical protein [Escherichia coli]MDW9276300.1 hypothetical protein [Escherichia coli]WGB18737.1 hypothetical protein NFL29_13485 [Escherichia coli]
MSEHMKILLATRNRYFEYGLSCLLKKEQTIVARNFFIPSNRWYVIEHDVEWIIISDYSLCQLMRCIFHGRKFLLLNVESVKEAEIIYDTFQNGFVYCDALSGALTMSEMVIMFRYFFYELTSHNLAKEMGIHIKTVSTLLYSGMTKNGFKRKGIKSLASFLLSR